MNRKNFQESWNETRTDYRAARNSRLVRRRTGLIAYGSGADYHVRNELDFLRVMEYARDMERNDIVMGQMADRAVGNIIQQGFGYDPQTGSRDLNSRLAEYWFDWANSPDLCDIQGEDCFLELSRQALRAVFRDGDIVGTGTVDGTLQMHEAHRVRTPRNRIATVKKNKGTIFAGFEMSKYRRRERVWISREEINPNRVLQRVGEAHVYPIRDSDGTRLVFHPRMPTRKSQTRGITAYAPLIEAAGMFDDLHFAALVQAQGAASYIFLEKIKNFWDDPNQLLENGPDGRVRVREKVHPGMVKQIGEEDSFEILSANVPSSEVLAMMKFTLQLISVNFGLPLQITLLDPKDTNFSGWRGAVDQARMGFRDRQQMMIERWYTPILRWKITQWLEDDPALAKLAEADGVDAFAHVWKPPRWPYIEPMKDAQARRIRKADLQTSPRRLAAEDGLDYDDVVDETIADNSAMLEKAIEAAQQINAKHGLEGDNALSHWDVLFPTNRSGLASPIRSGDRKNRKSKDAASNAARN